MVCNTGQSLYNARFGVHRNGPCYVDEVIRELFT